MNIEDKIKLKLEALRLDRVKRVAKEDLLEAKLKVLNDKNEQRRRFILGDTLTEEMQINPKAKAWVLRLLDTKLIRDRDRALFQLPAKTASVVNETSDAASSKTDLGAL